MKTSKHGSIIASFPLLGLYFTNMPARQSMNDIRRSLINVYLPWSCCFVPCIDYIYTGLTHVRVGTPRWRKRAPHTHKKGKGAPKSHYEDKRFKELREGSTNRLENRFQTPFVEVRGRRTWYMTSAPVLASIRRKRRRVPPSHLRVRRSG